MASEVAIQLTPYPAAFIVEHAKRKKYAAGYILGTVRAEEIVITDFIPHTHKDTEVPNTKAHRAELNRRRAAKRRYTTQDLIGWYSAGQPGADLSEEDYQLWCNAPSVIFHGRHCLHLHCEMPHEDVAEPRVSWTASVVFEDAADHTLKHISHKVTLAPIGNLASDVMLSHITSLALYNGGRPFARSKLLNLDEVAYVASIDHKSSTEAVDEEQRRLERAVAAAQEAVAGRSGGSKEAEELKSAIDNFRAIRDEALQRQRDQTGRMDFNSQQFKDALMMKCVATILRKELDQIEHLSTVYGDDAARRNAAGGEGNEKQQDQQQQQQQQQ
ncbi:hypothetical protein NESM_000373700 [Novymonas esmeraldas]|uniref:JAB1/MPN/MOV34 metalloenzyme domain-containing protein n=1 Tax=Novymonas esmeraldas TaxID=1808958 RepID=A0AAW0EKG2_9TRYP